MKKRHLLNTILFLFGMLLMLSCTESTIVEETELLTTKSSCGCAEHTHTDDCALTNTACPKCGGIMCSFLIRWEESDPPPPDYCECMGSHSHEDSCAPVGTRCPNCGKPTCRLVFGGDGGRYATYPTSFPNLVQSSDMKCYTFYFEGVLNAYKKLTVYINPGTYWGYDRRVYGVGISIYPFGTTYNNPIEPHKYWLSNGQENWQYLNLNEINSSSWTTYGIPVLSISLNGYLSETLEPEVYDRNIIEVFYYLEDVNDACDETFTVVIK